ncbi:hypothetical protein ACTOB_007912 [Actinoplanes oblitus]|uniref:Uncharacterized protein n=1 Tax=Actinoplanes oblitus TaxID=3040509 RepID=A0ABY8WD67_9ACTN|nr:hypothetical protein [Actinoplanes oblitus]WIM95781.1 hypothetical protein ACTOB_007912 [Actinoplanes oblitus]
MTMTATVIDDQERERRLREALCLWCSVPLPADASYQREFCGATCRQRNHRALKRAGLR